MKLSNSNQTKQSLIDHTRKSVINIGGGGGGGGREGGRQGGREGGREALTHL